MQEGSEYFIGDAVSAIVPPEPGWHILPETGERLNAGYAVTFFSEPDCRILHTQWFPAESFAAADQAARDYIRAAYGVEPYEVHSSRVPGTEHLPGINWPWRNADPTGYFSGGGSVEPH